MLSGQELTTADKRLSNPLVVGLVLRGMIRKCLATKYWCLVAFIDVTLRRAFVPDLWQVIARTFDISRERQLKLSMR